MREKTLAGRPTLASIDTALLRLSAGASER